MTLGDSWIVIIVIGAAVIIMFVIPLMTFANRTDDVIQMQWESAVSEFVNEAITTGEITQSAVSTLEQKLGSGGMIPDVQIAVYVLDENPGKKAVQTEIDKIGENYYYLKIINTDDSSELPYKLREGYIITTTAVPLSPSTGSEISSSFYSSIDRNNYAFKIEKSGLVSTSGK